MRGLHVHVGSQILQTEPLAAAVPAIAGLGEFEVYDLGGGLGARYTWADRPPSVPAYLDALVDAARAHLPAEAELIIEPGRSMVSAAACTVYRVVTVKRGARTFVAVDGGMSDNLEVALFGQRFEAGILGRLDAPGDLRPGRPALRERRRAGPGSPARRPRVGDLSSSPPPAPTASRWPTTTTATAGSRWCSRATAVAHRRTSGDLGRPAGARRLIATRTGVLARSRRG